MSTVRTLRLCLALATAVTAGCAVQSVSPSPSLPQNARAQGRIESVAFPNRQGPLLHVANAESSIEEFHLGASGDARPVRTIAGSLTQMGHGLGGIAVDSQGTTYATRVDGGVLEYARGAHGNVAPIRTISEATNGPIFGFQLAVDSHDNLYVANGEDIKVFAPGAHDVATPLRDIAGAATTIGFVEGIAIDGNDNLYAIDFTSVSVLKFAPGADGNVAPIARIAGANTKLAFPRYGGVSATGRVYVSDEGEIEVFGPHANGNVRPERQITFTGSAGPYSNIAIGKGLAFLGEFHGDSTWSIGVFRAGARGGSNPLRTIAGDATGLNEPVGLTVR